MGSSEVASNGNGYSLRWNDYSSNLTSSLCELRAEEKELLDVTLICDGRQLRAHKLILSACSKILRNVINSSRSRAEMTVLMWDISAEDMESLLTFMYEGEVNVSEAQLESFFLAAERLQVKGLSQIPRRQPQEHQDGNDLNSLTPSGHPDGRPKQDSPELDPMNSGHQLMQDESNLLAAIGSQEYNMSVMANSQDYVMDGLKEHPALADENLGKDGLCNFCQKKFKTKSHARTHMTDLHFPIPTECPNCHKMFASKPKMMRHRSKMCKAQKPSPPSTSSHSLIASSGPVSLGDAIEMAAVEEEMAEDVLVKDEG